jgi:hypothetical protein
MILVIANYRTGSTSFCKEVAEQKGYENLDECFAPQLGTTTVIENYDYVINNEPRDFRDAYELVVKIMPDHIAWCSGMFEGFFETLLSKTEKIYYTVRLDFEDQCKSYFLSDVSSQWHPGDKAMRHVKYVDEKYYLLCSERLFNYWLAIDVYFKRHPGEFVVLEDRKGAYRFHNDRKQRLEWPHNPFVAQIKQLDLFKELT